MAASASFDAHRVLDLAHREPRATECEIRAQPGSLPVEVCCQSIARAILRSGAADVAAGKRPHARLGEGARCGGVWGRCGRGGCPGGWPRRSGAADVAAGKRPHARLGAASLIGEGYFSIECIDTIVDQPMKARRQRSEGTHDASLLK